MFTRIKSFIKGSAVDLFRISGRELQLHEVFKKLRSRDSRVSVTKENLLEVKYKKFEKIYLRNASSDLLVMDQVLVDEGYQTLVHWIGEHSFSDKIKCIIDAGANIGLATLYLADQYKSASISAIEPSPGNMAILKLNTGPIQNRVTPLQAALWFEDGVVELQNDFRDKLEWSTRVSSVEKASTNSVEALTLSSIRKRMKFDSIDILKIDIEGAEGRLFEFADFLQELKGVKFLAIEIHEESADKIKVINQLQDIGFSLKYSGETLFGVNKMALNK